jgi:hypothetical protein
MGSLRSETERTRLSFLAAKGLMGRGSGLGLLGSSADFSVGSYRFLDYRLSRFLYVLILL